MFNKFNDDFVEEHQAIGYNCDKYSTLSIQMFIITLFLAITVMILSDVGGINFVFYLFGTAMMVSLVVLIIVIKLALKASKIQDNYKYKECNLEWWVKINEKGAQYLGYSLSNEDSVDVQYYVNCETKHYTYKLYDYLGDYVPMSHEDKYSCLSDVNKMHIISIKELWYEVSKDYNKAKEEEFSKKVAEIWKGE